jgi:hypothetical protein
VTVPDFIESTVAGYLATHHPYHMVMLACKWIYLHIVLAGFAVLMRMFFK